ncbi:hypothetical protein WBJ53_07660 [Spirosoma sp. SC4-14]|uniref:hypothetical protein n=1 Tax=Spirosoma sp. SC4-14 TaxID=3128900 RepID=UPI0030CDC067
MATERSSYLINQLISNNLSEAELDEFLAGLHQDDMLNAYSDQLEIYFTKLLNQHEQSIIQSETENHPVLKQNQI